MRLIASVAGVTVFAQESRDLEMIEHLLQTLVHSGYRFSNSALTEPASGAGMKPSP